MNPFFSVIVPVYNVEQYLPRCLHSLQEQTYTDFEVLLVDDGSPDGSNAICRKWAEKDARFHLIEKENAGLGYARNAGLDHASGQYVTYVDSDDYIVPNALEKVWKRLTETDADICYYGFLEVHSDTIIYGKPPQKLTYQGTERLAFMHQIFGPAPNSKEYTFAGVSACSGAYRRSLLEEHHVRFLSERECLCEDVFYNLTVCQHANLWVIEPSCLYAYCFNGKNSLTTRYREDRLEAAIHMYDMLCEKMRDAGYTDKITEERLGRSLMLNLIVCLKQEVGYAKANGLRYAMGRIALLCSHSTVREMEKGDWDLCAWGLIQCSEQGEFLEYAGRTERSEFFFASEEKKSRFLCRYFLRCRVRWEAWNRVFRRDIIEANHLRFGNERLIGAEDLDFCFRYLLHCENMVCLSACLYYYRMRDASIMHKKTWQNRCRQLGNMLWAEQESVGASVPFGKRYLNEAVMIATFLNSRHEGYDPIEKAGELRQIFLEAEYWPYLQQEMRLAVADREGLRQAGGRGYGDFLHALCCFLAEGDMPRFKKAVEQHYRNRTVYEWLRGVKNVAVRFVKNQKG